ncbi:hypothetical protein [Thiolapillus brandeum]|uniref:Uncharacterized protein n=1 Tax=Thiolapillus brandeum TaxID=1076588 RepID=A0A7U6JI29_9GAMM|nr:hypothetical protein [Thiolapillus brandeum]BAO43810.1 hypothetical protein TBH_C0876 [Thiolapillus brandeum]
MNIPGRKMAALAMLLTMGSAGADPAQELAVWQQQQVQALLKNGSTALEQMRTRPKLNLAAQVEALQGESYVSDIRKPPVDCESAQLILLPGTESAFEGQKLMIPTGKDTVLSVLICKTL